MSDRIARGISCLYSRSKWEVAMLRSCITFWERILTTEEGGSENWRKAVIRLAHLDQKIALLDDKIKRECEARR